MVVIETEIGLLAEDFLRARSVVLASKTLRNYRQALEQFESYLLAEGLSTEVPTSEMALKRSRRAVEGFTAMLIERNSKITAATRLAALKQFYRWAMEEDEIASNPIATLEPPTPDEVVRDVVTPAEQAALFAACERLNGFEGRRDAAIMKVFLGTGCRLGELVNMRVDDISPDRRRIRVMGKGRRERDLMLPPDVMTAVDRYLRARRRSPEAHSTALWLGSTGRGALTGDGVVNILKRRCRDAGIRQLHAHLFRHSWRHYAQMAGASDDTLMQPGGWRSRQMLDVYGASGKAERAAAEMQRIWREQR